MHSSEAHTLPTLGYSAAKQGKVLGQPEVFVKPDTPARKPDTSDYPGLLKGVSDSEWPPVCAPD